MNRRTGITLAEVLITIFVMVIGLLGVLSLFPLGAVRMAQAIKDDRCAIMASNTFSQTKWVWKEELGVGTPAPRAKYPIPLVAVPLPGGGYVDSFINSMDDPNYPFNPDIGPFGGIPPALQTTTSPVLPTYWTTRSYPVLIDPVGWNVNGAVTPQRYWVGGDTRSIPRRSLRRLEYAQDPTGFYTIAMPPATRMQLMHRFFIQIDDLSFGNDGSPMDGSGFTVATHPAGVAGMVPPGGGDVQRDGRYSCALLLKRERNQIFRDMEMSIVVYSGRSVDTPSAERVFPGAYFFKGSTEAFIPYTGEPPDLRKGNWILDATMTWQTPTGSYVPDPQQHGYFYRIVNVTNDTSTTPPRLILELQEPAQEHTWNNNHPGGYGIAVVMDNVVEVFSGKFLTPSAKPVP